MISPENRHYIPALKHSPFIEGIGFEEVNRLTQIETILGTLDFISARKPRS